MKKASFQFRILTALLCAAFLLSGCSGREKNTGHKLAVVCGVPPVAFIAARIGGDRIDVSSCLPPGRTPHDFSPRAATVKKVSQAALFLSTMQTFEQKIADALPEKVQICDITKGIRRIHFNDGSGEHRHCNDHSCANHEDGDPHVWLSAKNAEIIAENITAELCKIDPDGEKFYRKNCSELTGELQKLDQDISIQLRPFAGRTFFIYHPAFGYFARDYQLKQRAVELNGRETGAAGIADIIKEAKAAGATTIFVQKQFNPRTAQALAKHIGGSVTFLDPLAYDLTGNLRRCADAISGDLSGKER
ncbi:MAG: zinc ABC transporter substrate-binding protein [Lentisphaeria bacterium]|nr:zinc ABC transporter substrate-binding protein [Lentisphaeria bacterium]